MVDWSQLCQHNFEHNRMAKASSIIKKWMAKGWQKHNGKDGKSIIEA